MNWFSCCLALQLAATTAFAQGIHGVTRPSKVNQPPQLFGIPEADETPAVPPSQDPARISHALYWRYRMTWTTTGIDREIIDSKAAAFLKSRAEKGAAYAQYELALRYLEGRGVPRDPKAALEWMRKAAAQDYPTADERLAEFEELLKQEPPADGPQIDSEKVLVSPPVSTPSGKLTGKESTGVNPGSIEDK